jgi:hypothetical protein
LAGPAAEVDAVETTFRIDYSQADASKGADYASVFRHVSDVLCEECGGGCEGFFLTARAEEYQARQGPKIGWAVEGTTLLLRMAGCKALSRIERISQLLRHFGMTVVESRMIQ